MQNNKSLKFQMVSLDLQNICVWLNYILLSKTNVRASIHDIAAIEKWLILLKNATNSFFQYVEEEKRVCNQVSFPHSSRFLYQAIEPFQS